MGIFTFVSRSRLMAEKGFVESNIGSVINDFKKSFLNNGRIINLYSHVQFKNEKFHAGSVYLNSVIR